MDLHMVPEEECLSLHRYDWPENDESSLLLDVSSNSDIFCQTVESCFSPKNIEGEFKTKVKLGFDALPLTKELFYEMPKDLMLVGRIHSIVQTIVIVLGEQKMMPIDVGFVLFIAPDKPLGQVFDVFEPFYCIIFDNVEQLKEKNIGIGDNVFFVSENYNIPPYAFVDELQKKKMSDALWKYNNEPPEKCSGYSEVEKWVRQKTRSNLRQEQILYNDCESPAKSSRVEYDPPSQQTQTSVLKSHQTVIEVQAPILQTPVFQPPLSQNQVQRPVQEPLVEPQKSFQMQMPYYPPKLPYLLPPITFQTHNFASRQQFLAQMPEIQQQLIQQQISVASSYLSMATMISSRVGCEPPQAPVFQPFHFQFQVQRPAQLVEAPLIMSQQPFQMQIPFHHTFHLNNCIEPGLIHPQVSHLQASTSFQTQVPRIQQQPIQYQTFNNIPSKEVSQSLS